MKKETILAVEKRSVTINSTEGLAPNIAGYLTGKLNVVGEKIHGERLWYIIENSQGIKCQVPSDLCEFKIKKTNKKNK
tara:strand:+ start:7901 stop:8134 length:234 start_codon:yes stop_codon:yes gene_type:complete